MQTRKSKVFPIIITILLIIIIIYLFSTVKQPYVLCDNEKNTDANVLVREEVKANLNSNKISKLYVVKTIILDDKYSNSYDKYLDSIEYSLKSAYKYLGDSVSFKKEDNKIKVIIDASKDETIILNDLDFYNNDGLQIKIEANTKSSSVTTLSISDEYTEGELMTRMKNNGYSCK